MFGLEIKRRDIEMITILDLSGQIEFGISCGFFVNTLNRLSNQGKNQILLNFAEIIYIDKFGLQELIKINRTITQFGGRIRILNLNQKSLEIMSYLKLLSIIEAFENEAMALSSFTNDVIKRNFLNPVSAEATA